MLKTVLPFIIVYALLLAYGFIFAPKVKLVDRSSIGGSNARNKVLSIRMADDDRYLFAPVLAQECYESRFKLIRSILSQLPFMKRKMEIMGHEIEVQMAWLLGLIKTEEIASYRASEALVLTRYKQFKGVAQADIDRDMWKVRNKALNWCKKNRSKITKISAGLGR